MSGMVLVEQEARDLCIGLDGRAPTERSSDAMRVWLRGASALPPHGLYGAQSSADEAETAERDVGYIMAEPGRGARRVLGLSTPPANVASLDDGRRTDRRKTRIETGLAVLALAAPEPMPDLDFFRAVYGFEFNPAIHPAVLDALVSRMRKALRDVGTLDRTAGQLSVTFTQTVILPDPRCAQPIEERVLRVLVRAQEGSAKDAATRLGLPLRTIQEALKELTEGGACIKRRDGRQIAYVIEDTTFTPPTQSGVVGR